MRKIIGLTLLVIIAIIGAYKARDLDREDREERMDKAHLRYDADGLFILVDVSEGHMGIYDRRKPLKHIWDNQFCSIKPDVYAISVSNDGVALDDEQGHLFPLELTGVDSLFFQRHVTSGVPVLAYNPHVFMGG